MIFLGSHFISLSIPTCNFLRINMIYDFLSFSSYFYSYFPIRHRCDAFSNIMLERNQNSKFKKKIIIIKRFDFCNNEFFIPILILKINSMN